MKAKLKRINDVFSWILLIAVSILLIISVFRVIEAKKTGESAFVLGYRTVFVLSGSMEPYMMTNSMALTKQVDEIDELAVGDVITFHLDSEEGDPILITHRIAAIDDGYIYTKGDNNRVADSIPLTMENVEAKVVVVFNQVAWLIAKWQTTTGKMLLISGVAAIILLYISLKVWIKFLLARRKESIANEAAVVDAEIVPSDAGEEDQIERSTELHHTTPE